MDIMEGAVLALVLIAAVVIISVGKRTLQRVNILTDKEGNKVIGWMEPDGKFKTAWVSIRRKDGFIEYLHFDEKGNLLRSRILYRHPIAYFDEHGNEVLDWGEYKEYGTTWIKVRTKTGWISTYEYDENGSWVNQPSPP